MHQFPEAVGSMPEIDLTTKGNQIGFAIKTMFQNPLMMAHGIYDAKRDNDLHVAYDVLASMANQYHKEGHGMYKLVLEGKEVVVVYRPDIMDEMIKREAFPENAFDKDPMGIAPRAMGGKDAVEPILGTRRTHEDFIASIASLIDRQLARDNGGHVTEARRLWYEQERKNVIDSKTIELANFDVILRKTLPTINWTHDRISEVVNELNINGKLGGDVFFGAIMASNEAIQDPISHFEQAAKVYELTGNLFEKLYSWREKGGVPDILNILETGIPNKSKPMTHEGSRRAAALNFWYASAHTIKALTNMMYYQFSQNPNLFWTIDPTKHAKEIAHEGARLVTPLPFTLRATTSDTTLKGNFLEKGTLMVVMIRWPMMHPDYISDPQEFRLRRPPHEEDISKRAFGYGGQGFQHRFCLGYQSVTDLVGTDIRYLQSKYDRFELLSGGSNPSLLNGTMDMLNTYRLIPIEH